MQDDMYWGWHDSDETCRSVLICEIIVHNYLIPNSAPHTHTNTDLIKYAATPLHQPQQCFLTDYFNNYNFSKLK
jgi:hypothetical protein